MDEVPERLQMTLPSCGLDPREEEGHSGGHREPVSRTASSPPAPSTMWRRVTWEKGWRATGALQGEGTACHGLKQKRQRCFEEIEEAQKS